MKEKIEKIESYAQWAHLDVEDGKFIPYTTWNNPEDVRWLQTKVKLEAHLMIENPEVYAEDWLRAGVKRIIVHFEALKEPQRILELCKTYGAEAAIAFNPETAADIAVPYARLFAMALFLSVHPGPSGQEFIKETPSRIAFLRSKNPDIPIEVDGGVNMKTIQDVKRAGATIFVAGNYIFGHPDPVQAIKELEESIQ